MQFAIISVFSFSVQKKPGFITSLFYHQVLSKPAALHGQRNRGVTEVNYKLHGQQQGRDWRRGNMLSTIGKGFHNTAIF